MKTEGFSGELHPGITMHKIPVHAGVPGVLFTVGMLSVFLLGIPAFGYFLVFATVLGIVFAVMLRFIPREAGLVAFVCTAALVVYFIGIPAIEDWTRGAEIDLTSPTLAVPVVVPPPNPPYEPLTFRCDSQRDRGQKKPGPPSVFDGTWEGKMNDLPGVNLIVADAGGGQIGGVITFYFQTREDGGNWQVRGKSVAPMLAAHTQDKALIFEVQHHKNHGSAEFGPDVTFRMELTGENKAMLSNISEPSTAPVKILRRE